MTTATGDNTGQIVGGPTGFTGATPTGGVAGTPVTYTPGGRFGTPNYNPGTANVTATPGGMSLGTATPGVVQTPAGGLRSGGGGGGAPAGGGGPSSGGQPQRQQPPVIINNRTTMPIIQRGPLGTPYYAVAPGSANPGLRTTPYAGGAGQAAGGGLFGSGLSTPLLIGLGVLLFAVMSHK